MYKQRIRKLLSDRIIKPICYRLYRLKYYFLDPAEKTIEVKIGDITSWYRGNRYDEFTFPGVIKGGDWNNKKTPKAEILKSWEKYQSMEEHFKKGVPWQETRLFRNFYQRKFREGLKVHGYGNPNDLEAYYKKRYDKLFERIRENGVLPASGDNPEIEPIYVHIDRDGEILYTVDGNQRLGICMILGIEKIPVRVWMRHREWQQKREKILGASGAGVTSPHREFLDHADIASEREKVF